MKSMLICLCNIIFIILNFIANPTHAQNLCKAQEVTVFNCKIKSKTASLCMSKISNAFHYRYGTDRKIELTYPSINKGTEKYFFLSNRPYAGGGETHIRFTNNKYTYYLYDKNVKDGEGLNSTAGLYIFLDKKKLSKLQCANDASIRSPAYDNLSNEGYIDIDGF